MIKSTSVLQIRNVSSQGLCLVALCIAKDPTISLAHAIVNAYLSIYTTEIKHFTNIIVLLNLFFSPLMSVTVTRWMNTDAMPLWLKLAVSLKAYQM
jgi:hypothetical protein